LIQDLDSR